MNYTLKRIITTCAISIMLLAGFSLATVYAQEAGTTGKLTVEKDTTGGNDTFSFTADGGLSSFNITTVSGIGTKVFNNITPGTYHINELFKSNWTQNSNGCSTVTVGSGENKTCVVHNTSGSNNGGTGEIRGIKFEDWDGDKSPYVRRWERRLSGWTIFIDANNNGALDTGETSTVTSKKGAYSFMGLAPGTYHVCEVMQAGWMEITPASVCYTVTLTADQVSRGNDFGNFKMGGISGMKFYDLNGNGKKGGNETGLAGWTISLTKPDGSVVTTITDANGNYTFSNLGPGKYRVREVKQTNWQQTSEDPKDITIYSGRMVKAVNFGNNHLGDPIHGNNKDKKDKNEDDQNGKDKNEGGHNNKDDKDKKDKNENHQNGNGKGKGKKD